jgi:hypothetical protein
MPLLAELMAKKVRCGYKDFASTELLLLSASNRLV